jgi:hypothetical protein
LPRFTNDTIVDTSIYTYEETNLHFGWRCAACGVRAKNRNGDTGGEPGDFTGHNHHNDDDDESGGISGVDSVTPISFLLTN